MRNARIEQFDDVPRDVLPIGNDFAPGELLARHAHRRAQLLYAARGVMVLEAEDATWTVPTARAVMIPPGVPHAVRMLDVSTLSLYIEPRAVPWWPERCTVIDVSPLLDALLRAAAGLAIDYDLDGRAGALVRLALLELGEAAPLPLAITLPRSEVLRACCTDYLAHPRVGVTNAEWARRCAVSERSLDRAFRRETGSSPAAWRTRARLLAAVPLLRRARVTDVALELGYASAAAFTTAFTRAFGEPPSRFR